MTDPRFAELESHRPYLLRHALAQLRDGQLEETEAICKAEGITASNCWVLLHRARLALRAAWSGAGSGWERSVKDEKNCRAASRLLSLAYERSLTADELAALQRHLERCFMCRNFDSQQKFLHHVSQRYRTED